MESGEERFETIVKCVKVTGFIIILLVIILFFKYS